MESEQVSIEKQAGRIINQLRALTNKAIDILYDDGLLSYGYISALLDCKNILPEN